MFKPWQREKPKRIPPYKVGDRVRVTTNPTSRGSGVVAEFTIGRIENDVLISDTGVFSIRLGGWDVEVLEGANA